LIAFIGISPNTQKDVIWLSPYDVSSPPTQIMEYPYDPALDTPGVTSLFWTEDGKWLIYTLDFHEIWKVRVFD